ncbi:hypothetical protein QBC39DRAFT_365372 [Podospora conica]|nr:hypothetical protein QBC39DRAFT_365372 [Schizothecium conicum]
MEVCPLAVFFCFFSCSAARHGMNPHGRAGCCSTPPVPSSRDKRPLLTDSLNWVMSSQYEVYGLDVRTMACKPRRDGGNAPATFEQKGDPRSASTTGSSGPSASWLWALLALEFVSDSEAAKTAMLRRRLERENLSPPVN